MQRGFSIKKSWFFFWVVLFLTYRSLFLSDMKFEADSILFRLENEKELCERTVELGFLGLILLVYLGGQIPSPLMSPNGLD